MADSLRILQWNSRSIKHKLVELLYDVQNFYVMLFSKTRLKPIDFIYIRNFDIIRRNRIGPCGGIVAIFGRSNIKY